MKALALLLALVATAASAGTHKLLDFTDTSADVTAPCPEAPPVAQAVVAINTGYSAGGNDATSASLTLSGTVSAGDVEAVAVYYGGALVGIAYTPDIGSEVLVELPGSQRGGQPFSIYLYFAPGAAGKTYYVTVSSVAGTNNAALPATTATRSVATPTCE